MHAISAIYISRFMPLKSTSAFPWNLIEIVPCVKAWKKTELRIIVSDSLAGSLRQMQSIEILSIFFSE